MPNREVLEGQPVAARFLGSHPLVKKPYKSMNWGGGGMCDGWGSHSQKKGLRVGGGQREKKRNDTSLPPHIP